MLSAAKVVGQSPDALGMKHNTWQLLENAVLETLEDRRMMSASPLGISLNKGTLSLNSDAATPTQMVVDYRADKSELYARIGSVIRNFPVSQVQKINVHTGNGNDYVYINPHIDADAVIAVGNGNDSIHAGGGNAQITGGNGSDVIYTAQGNNDIHLGNGNNNVLGGPGNDKIVVGDGNNYVYGGAGDDSITAGSGNNRLLGASGNDSIVAGSGNNFINGGVGNDNLTAGTGQDSIMGYSGNDNLAGGGVGSVVSAGQGTNTVNGQPASTQQTPVGKPQGTGNSGDSGNPITPPVTGTGSSTGKGTTGTGSTGTGGTGTGTGATGTGSTGTGSGKTGTGSTGTGTTPITPGSGSTGTGSGTTGSGTGTTPTGSGAIGVSTQNGGTVSKPATNANAPKPTPVLNLLAGQREIGLGVNVEALSSKLAVGTPLTAVFQWSFGDPGTNFNTMTGYNAGHVYDKPGTYDITLTITNQAGGVASVSQKVTIAASSRKQVFVDSVNGSDSNPGTQNAPYRSVAQAFNNLQDNTEILLHAGEKFNVTASLHVSNKNILVGSYGSGANPVLNRIKGDGVSTIATFSRTDGATFQNLTFDSPYGVGPNDPAPKNSVGGFALAGSNVVVRDCTFLNVDDAINENGNPTGVLIQGNNAPLATGLRGYFVWGQGAQTVIVGNTAVNSTREHILRMVDMTEVTIENNTLSNLDRSKVDVFDYSKGSIEIHRASDAYIVDNVVADGDIRLGPLGLWGETGSSSTDWSVIEDNQLTNTMVSIDAGTHHAIIANNVITNNTSAAINISGVDGQGRLSEDITLVNNTVIDNGTNGNFLRLGGYVNGIVMTNNMWVAPKVVGITNEAPVLNYSPNLDSFTTIAGNIWPAQSNNTIGGTSVSDTQWGQNSKVHGDVFRSVVLSDTYQMSLGALKAGANMARAA